MAYNSNDIPKHGGVVIDKAAAVRIATSIGWKSPSELNETFCKGRDDGFESGRLAGIKQERALWELAKIGQEIEAQPKEPEQEPVTVLPDGSAFAVMSYPLPKDHWLYAERQYEGDADEPNELGKPILTHALRDAVVSAVRYAIRGATNCGKELDFDPDALVQNAVYALCGPYGLAESKKPEQEPVAAEREAIAVWLEKKCDEQYLADRVRARGIK